MSPPIVDMDRFGHWDDAPNEEWLRFALSCPHVGTWHVNPAPADFQARCEAIARKFYGTVDHWVYWVSVLGEKDNRTGGWCKHFPHNHGYDGLTIVYYAQVPLAGGELVIYENYKEASGRRQVLHPKVGDYAIIFDHEVHGVRSIYGDFPRVTLIGGAYPYPKGPTKCQCGEDWKLLIGKS